MDIFNKIKAFDEKVNKDIELLSTQIDDNLQFDFSQSKEFILDKNINTDIFDNIPNQKGIYLFEVKLNSEIKGSGITTKVANFAQMYSIYLNRHTYSSKIINKRLEEKKKSHQGEWLPIYIGKCRNIRDRIKQHIYLPTESRTYAMKLESRENLYGLSFRISYIKIDIKNYDLIMTFIEKKLRDKYMPIIGKQ